MKIMVTPGYYKTSSGSVCKVLYEATHSETGDVLVVFHSIDKKDEIWATPQKQFLRDGYEKIGNEYPHITGINSGLSITFPDINYTNEIPLLVDSKTFSKSVKAMITLLTNKGIVAKNLFDGLANDDDIESLILGKIKAYEHGDDIEDVFHLIQVWGGITGRGIYIFNELFDWNKIVPHYKKLVARCLSTKDISDKSIDKIIESIIEFNTKVKHIGVSFITKHTRYWLYNSIGERALPIYDNIMAKYVMQQNYAQINHLREYWKAMIAKSTQLHISLLALERQIYKHIYNQQ